MFRILGQVVVMTGVAASLSFAAPAVADVKAGVDAWGRGDYAAAVREWVGPAERGDADAQFNLAQAYRLGRGVEANQAQAEALYQLAAAQGHLRAADAYGLILFQKGEREKALPYLEGAVMRGDPRAQYLMGIAYFNGDLVGKDWRRAYALASLANAAGLPQAKGALAQMDQHIPLADRQAAQMLATEIKTKAEATRARELAAVDLALASETAAPRVTPPDNAVPSRPGVDYSTRSPHDPAAIIVASAEPAERPTAMPPVRRAAPPTSTPATPARMVDKAPTSGPWKLQLGAFGVAGNADALWNKLSGRNEIAGRQKIKQPAGRLTKLLAGGYATQEEATSACAALKRAGHDCLVTR